MLEPLIMCGKCTEEEDLGVYSATPTTTAQVGHMVRQPLHTADLILTKVS